MSILFIVISFSFKRVFLRTDPTDLTHTSVRCFVFLFDVSINAGQCCVRHHKQRRERNISPDACQHLDVPHFVVFFCARFWDARLLPVVWLTALLVRCCALRPHCDLMTHPLWYILKCLLEPPPARTVIRCFVFLLFRSFVLFCVCLLFWSPHGKNHSLRFTERHWPDLPVSLWSLPVTTVCHSCSPVERYRGFFLLLVCYALFLFFPAQGFLFVLYGPPLWPYGPPNCRHYANSGPKDWQSTRCRPMVERTHWTAFTCWTNFGPCRL